MVLLGAPDLGVYVIVLLDSVSVHKAFLYQLCECVICCVGYASLAGSTTNHSAIYVHVCIDLTGKLKRFLRMGFSRYCS